MVSSLRISRSTKVMGRLASVGWLPPSTIAPRGARDVDRLAECRRRSRCLQHQVRASIGEAHDLGRDVIVIGVQGAMRPERQGGFAVPRDEVCGDDEPRADDPQPLDEHKADRSRPEDDGRVAGPEAAQVQHVTRDRRWLDECRRLERQLVRNEQEVARREGHELGEGAVAARADERVGDAGGEPPGTALRAGMARDERDERGVTPTAGSRPRPARSPTRSRPPRGRGSSGTSGARAGSGGCPSRTPRSPAPRAAPRPSPGTGSGTSR